MKKLLFLLPIIVLLAAACSSVSKKPETTKPTTQTPSTQTSVPPVAEKLTIYADPDSNIKFLYPAGIVTGKIVSTPKPALTIAFFKTEGYGSKKANDTQELINGLYGSITIVPNPDKLKLADFVKKDLANFQTSQSPTTVNGKPAILVKWTDPKNLTGKPPYPLATYFLEQNGKMFQIDGATTNNPATQDQIKLFEKIVNTFGPIK